MSATGELWSRLAGLTVEIERWELELLGEGWRRTGLLRACAGDRQGLGEDVTWEGRDHDLWVRAFGEASRQLPRGRMSLADLAAQLDRQAKASESCTPIWPKPPLRDTSRDYRRWALESAALDLALKQSGQSLAEVLGRELRPMTFVASTGLPTPPSTEILTALAARCEGLRFKLDPVKGWSRQFLAELANRGDVAVLDFKGFYVGTPVDTEPDQALVETILELFPAVILEDPWPIAELEARLESCRDRVSWDAPIHGPADLEARPWRPRVLNIKPSRFGPIATLLETIEIAQQEEMRLFAGGQFEQGPGREAVQTIAALFCPDGPNDCAPRDFNQRPLPDALPASPLVLEAVPGLAGRPRREA